MHKKKEIFFMIIIIYNLANPTLFHLPLFPDKHLPLNGFSDVCSLSFFFFANLSLKLWFAWTQRKCGELAQLFLFKK